MQLSQPPDSAHLLQPFSYTTAKLSRCFQLRVPRKAAQQPEGPGSGMDADGGHRGVNSSCPQSRVPPGSRRQEDAAMRGREGPGGPACPHLPVLPARPQTPCAVDVGAIRIDKASSIPSSCVYPQACSSPPQAGKTPTAAITGALTKGAPRLHSARPQPGPHGSVRA